MDEGISFHTLSNKEIKADDSSNPIKERKQNYTEIKRRRGERNITLNNTNQTVKMFDTDMLI